METSSKRAVRSVDVAKRAGVSRTTVSYVLNGRTDVSIPEETRTRVFAAAADLGYSPNMAARALVRGKTDLISLWMIGSTIRIQADVIEAMQDLLQEEQHEMIISRFAYASEDGRPPKPITDWPVDGVLAFNTGIHTPPGMSLNVPMVSMGCYYSEAKDYVGIDLRWGTVEAVNHLVKSGRKRIGYLVNKWGAHPGDARFDGYNQVMQSAGLQPALVVVEEGTRKSGYKAIQSEDLKQFDALFCFNDELAMGAYRGIVEAGLSVPNDIALIGCDGLEELAYVGTPISSIAQPTEEMCRLAWQFLKNRIEDPELPPQQVVLRPELKLRASSQNGIGPAG